MTNFNNKLLSEEPIFDQSLKTSNAFIYKQILPDEYVDEFLLDFINLMTL